MKFFESFQFTKTSRMADKNEKFEVVPHPEFCAVSFKLLDVYEEVEPTAYFEFSISLTWDQATLDKSQLSERENIQILPTGGNCIGTVQ